MARTKAQAERPDFIDPATIDGEPDMNLLSTAPDEWEFETVVDETPARVIFDNVGDTFVGQYVEMLHVEQEPDKNGVDQSFDLYVFRGRDGNLYSINRSFKMEKAMGKVEIGDWCRITFVKEIDSNKGNPMKDLKVEVRRS